MAVPGTSAEVCPSEDELGEFLAGVASKPARDRIEHHIDACSRCAQTVALFGGAFGSTPPASVGSLERELSGGDSTAHDHDVLAAPEQPPGPLLGSLFADRYEIRACVGFGAGGTVYAAYDPELDRQVALKLLRASVVGGSQHAGRWTREAKIMARVVHPNVVAVFDVGAADGHVFIAAEFVDGSTLDAWRKAQPRRRDEILGAFVAAGRGLAAIHACGLVHRDFKPHNVLIGRDGRVRVTDFGLARLQGDGERLEEAAASDMAIPALREQTAMTLTRTGAVVGTPAYMAPEQWRGQAVDTRADQFAFGVALFEALFGERPWQGRTAAELAAAVTDTPPKLPAHHGVPRWIVRVLLRALAADPAQRFADMNALLDALVDTPGRRRRRQTAALVTVGFAAVAATSWSLGQTRGDPQCQGDAGLSQAWSDDVRAQLREAWPTIPETELATSFARVDAWVARWREAHDAACRGPQDEGHVRTVQLRCFERRASELRASLAIAAQLSSDDARDGDLLAPVGEPERCLDGARLSAIEPIYSTPAAHVLSLQLAESIDRVEALRFAGRHEEALAIAIANLARAEIDGDHALRAEALLGLGQVHSMHKDAALAEAILRKAAWAADASGHVEVAADAWVDLVAVLGTIEEKHAAAREAGERAEAALYRLDDPSRSLTLASNLAVVTSLQGDYEGALRQHLDVLDRAQQFGDKGARQIPRVHMNAAAVLAHLGRLDEAVAHTREGIAQQEQLYPGPHTVTAEMYNTLGAIEVQRGHLDEGRAALEHGLELAAARMAQDNPTIIGIHSNLAAIALKQHRLPDAIDGYTRVLALYRGLYGERHPDIALAMHNLAGAYDEVGRRDEAIALYREALEIRSATSGPEHPGTANTMHNLGRMLSASGPPERRAEGLALLERALALREQANIDPWRRASTCWALARGYDIDGQRDRAIAMAQRARALLREVGDRDAEFVKKLEQWLAEHPAKQGA
jgi:serine/threonine-protein kinase